ncbi:hypothetical protein EDE04_4660 [Streptomyces sp. 2132.2]|uniref:hypothetical protein n=1 Tax=Streptomyces sp. 2132.2 TaxID=2485161 RepID=UPI000FAAA8F2|nr:hypothetical protein [Streptomyces sp. 2132.2]ROQ98134.1 hypothetical protein EDE04_4660 [Streptomyces sp. 2132.2]
MTEKPSTEEPAATPSTEPADPAPAASTSNPSADSLTADVQRGAEALLKLGASSPELARTLSRVIEAVALEAARTARFSRTLGKALSGPADTGQEQAVERRQRSSRRAKGLIDPFAVFAVSGEDGLRARLSALDLEQLRDIVAEHGMDHDRLAMKWKDPQRVLDRIVERVEARISKGSAFRSSTGSTPAGEE